MVQLYITLLVIALHKKSIEPILFSLSWIVGRVLWVLFNHFRISIQLQRYFLTEFALLPVLFHQ
jgi:hypothetical protein